MDEQRPFELLIVGAGSTPVTFIRRLIEGLVKEGVRVTLASYQYKRKNNNQPQAFNWLWTPTWDKGVFARVFRLIAMLIKTFPWRNRKWLCEAFRQAPTLRGRFQAAYRLMPFANGSWDVIYFPWNSAAIGYKALYGLGVPVVVSCRGSQVNIRPVTPGNEQFVEGLRETLQAAAAVHCVSEDIRQQAMKLGAIPQKTHVIHPAVDPTFFTPAGSKPLNQRFTIITTGSLVWLKGYEYALMALKRLTEKGLDCELQIIGDGSELQRILFTRRDLDLEERVTLFGKLPETEVRQHLQMADAFLLSSLSEGISNAVIEAMSCGLPVMTTDCGGMSELVTDGVEGFLVPVRDAEAMAERLAMLALDVTLRERMGKAGRERILTYFDISDQIQGFKDLLMQARGD